jgi:hypothetical protein
MKKNNMLKKIWDNVTITEDGNCLLINENNNCLFCEKSFTQLVPFNFVKNNKEYLVNVPMCKKHLDILDKDLYKLKL